MNGCRACGQDLGSLSAFDAHRRGTHDYTFVEGLRMDPPREDGRRCLDVDELEAAGWRRDRHGRWRTPRPDTEMPFWDRRSAKSGDGTPSPDPEPIPGLEIFV